MLFPLPPQLEAFDVPGLSLAIIKDDVVIAAEGHGVCRFGGRPVDAHTLFAAGSISKSFTSTCLAMLAGEGKLDWDERVTRYLPGFQLYDTWATREMTVRDLLSHRSGLADVSGGTVWYGSTYDRPAVVHRLRHLKPVSSFRSRFAYQNVTYLVAGEIIQAIAGQSWDDFVRARVFAPLGMTDSNTRVRALAGLANVAMPHIRLDGALREVPYRDYDNVGPAASLNTSAADLIQYARLYLNGGSVGGQALTEAKAFATLTEAQTVIPIEPGAGPLRALTPNFDAYGLGWFLRDYRGRRLVSHSGGVDGMRAIMAIVPEERLGVVVLSNQEEPLAAAALYSILDEYLGGSQTDWFAAFMARRQTLGKKAALAKQAVADARVAGTSPSLPIAAYAGRYTDPLYGAATIGLEAGRLVLWFSRTPSFTGDLSHWHYDTFRIDWRDPVIPPGLITFPLTPAAQVDEMRFDQPKLLDVDFGELSFRRVPGSVAIG